MSEPGESVLPPGARPLTGEFYVRSQEVFRQSTDQNMLMLDETLRLCRDRSGMSLLSVGSGSGLFEIPLLRALEEQGRAVGRFVGVEPNRLASRELTNALEREFSTRVDYEVHTTLFQEFGTSAHFDLVIFNHVFEYLDGDHREWMKKSLDLLRPSGRILIFSPMRGGINTHYAQFFLAMQGREPYFANDLHALLSKLGLDYHAKRLDACCDLTPLSRGVEDGRYFPLLSFLTQLDCRGLPKDTHRRFSSYYLNLRKPGQLSINHPAVMFQIPDKPVNA